MSENRSTCDCNVDTAVNINRHIAQRFDGERCMVVIDPETRKLLIPCKYVYPTRAQQRTTTPSLCLLFLRGRCRQGAECHQVHAMLNIVIGLRSEVRSLPWCCVFHGDEDYACVLVQRTWMSRIVLFMPEVDFESGYIPLSRVSYSSALRRLLRELFHRVMSEGTTVNISDKNEHCEDASRIVLDARDQTLCRLHVFDRCRYAEDCRFMHLCKNLTASMFGSRYGGGEKVALRGQKSTSVFLVSRQERLRGYPLQFTTNEHMEPKTLVPPWKSIYGNSKSNTHTSLHSALSPVLSNCTTPIREEEEEEGEAITQGHCMLPLIISARRDSSFTAETSIESANSLFFSDDAIASAPLSSDQEESRVAMTLSTTALTQPLSTCTSTTTTTNVAVVDCFGSGFESDGEVNTDCLLTSEVPLGQATDVIVSRDSTTSAGCTSGRYWQHNPYQATPLLCLRDRVTV